MSTDGPTVNDLPAHVGPSPLLLGLRDAARREERRDCIVQLLRLALAYRGSDLEEGILAAVRELRGTP